MKSLKLTEIIASLTAGEMKRFKKFVESPYHNRSEMVLKLFKEVEKFYPWFGNKNYNLNYIYKKIFPQKKYHDGVIRNLVSDLYKLSKNFLVIDNLMNHTIEYDLSLLKSFKERSLDDLVHLNYKKIRTNIESMKEDDNYYFNMYQLEDEVWSMFIIDKKAGKKHEELIKSTVENTNLLGKFFLARILKSYCSIVSNSVDFNVKPQLIFYNDIKNHLEKYKYDDSPVISLYFDSLKLTLGNYKETLFKKLHSGIIKNKAELHHDDIHVLYINLLNNAIFKKDYRSCHEIIKEVYSGQYYSRKGEGMFMEYGFYSAAVHTAIYLKEFEWLENFLKISREYINPPHRKNAFNYHSALFEFVRKNFENALRSISNLKPNDFFELLYTQRLRLMVYYELGKTEELYYLMDSYKHTISRYVQVESRFRKTGKDFIDKLLELVKLNEKFDSYKHAKLKEKISKMEGITIYKEWFTEKLAGMS